MKILNMSKIIPRITLIGTKWSLINGTKKTSINDSKILYIYIYTHINSFLFIFKLTLVCLSLLKIVKSYFKNTNQTSN